MELNWDERVDYGSIFDLFDDNWFGVDNDVHHSDNELLSEGLFDSNFINGPEFTFDESYNSNTNFYMPPNDEALLDTNSINDSVSTFNESYNWNTNDPEFKYHVTNSNDGSYIGEQQLDLDSIPEEIPIIEIYEQPPTSNPIQSFEDLSEFLIFNNTEPNEHQSIDVSDGSVDVSTNNLTSPNLLFPFSSVVNTTNTEFQNDILVVKPREKRSYGKRTLEERKARKKEQNKRASIIYRNKRRRELEDTVRDEVILLEENSRLREKVNEISSEIKYVKKFLRTMLIKKGCL